MDNLIYIGDATIGFTNNTELGMKYKSPLLIDGVEYESLEQFILLFQSVILKDGASWYYWQRNMPHRDRLKVYTACMTFLADVYIACKHLDQEGWSGNAWSFVEQDLMMKALNVKFKDEKLKQILLSTGDKELQFCDDHMIWGRRFDNGFGDNALGKCLMLLRSKLT